MKQKAINKFSQGHLEDQGPYNTPPTCSTWTWNMRRLASGRDELLLQSEAGTLEVGALSEGFLPLAAVSYAGVAYIASHNAATGESELGSFPSPDPASDRLVPRYAPLQNYQAPFTEGYGPFRTRLLGYGPERFLDMAAQPSYDGTVNLVLVDGHNPPRLINSRFSALPDGTYTIVDRRGRDANLYESASFASTLNLIQRSDKLLQADFEGVSGGGQLPSGSYRLYFRYATSDGNMTDVVAETGSVPVFQGTTLGAVRGGAPGEKTDKRIAFRLRNVDESFTYLEVYYTLSHGAESVARETRRVLTRFQIRGSEMDFTLTGFEPSDVVPAEELSTSFASIAHFKTVAQAQNRLFPAGAVEVSRDYALLERLGQKVTLAPVEAKVPVISGQPGQTLATLFETPVLETTPAGGSDGWRGGYANPMNVYHRTGYFGGEAYPFALAFIYPDGSLSPGVPVIGYDAVNGLPFPAAPLAEEGAAFDPATGLNGRGVLRFPNRDKGAPLLQNGLATVNGVRFRFPALADPDFIAIRRETVGCVLLRGERREDLLMQGFLVPAISAAITPPAGETYDHLNPLFDNPMNLKYVPAFLGALEANRFDQDGEKRTGLFPAAFYHSVNGRQVVQRDRFAFLSGDYLVDEEGAGGELDSDALRQLRLVGRVTSLLTAPVAVDRPIGTATQTYSLALCQAVEPLSAVVLRPVRTSFVRGFEGGFNQHGFSSGLRDLECRYHADDYGRIDADFNAYAGIQLQEGQTLDPTAPLHLLRQTGLKYNSSGERLPSGAGTAVTSAYLANVYRGGTQLTTAQLAALYGTLDGVRYTPISQRLYWDDVEAGLGADRGMTLFGGDCFIGLPLRRLYVNPFREGEMNEWEVNVGETVQLCHESKHNLLLRDTAPAGTTEELATGYRRSFAPYLTTQAAARQTAWKQNGLRQSRVQESAAYNLGLSESFSQKLYTLLPEDAPFIARSFDTRVYFSEPHIPLAFANGYRNIAASAYRDFPRHLGAITRLVSRGQDLFCIHQHGVTQLAVNERVETASGTGGSVFLAPGDVLGPTPRVLSAELGATWPGAVVATDNAVYGVDLNRFKIWKTEGEGLKTVSDFAVQRTLRRVVGALAGHKPVTGRLDVRAFRDPVREDVLFVFYGFRGDLLDPEKTVTLVYNELLGQWEGHFGLDATQLFSLPSGTYAFGSETGSALHQLHQEKDAEGKPNHARFFGREPRAGFEFVVAGEERETVERMFDNLVLATNGVYPSKITYSNDGQQITELIVYDKGILRNNARFQEGAVRVTIGKTGRVRLRDKFLRVRVEYETADRVLVHYIETHFRNSYI
jgi:hypothetical protein